jgi:hypothetical protein
MIMTMIYIGKGSLSLKSTPDAVIYNKLRMAQCNEAAELNINIEY